MLCIRVTIFSKVIPPGFKFTELHALTLAAHSYAFLVCIMGCGSVEYPTNQLQCPETEQHSLSMSSVGIVNPIKGN